MKDFLLSEETMFTRENMFYHFNDNLEKVTASLDFLSQKASEAKCTMKRVVIFIYGSSHGEGIGEN